MLKLIRENNIPFSLVPIQKLNSLTPENHQGIVGILSSIQFSKIEDFVIDDDENIYVPQWNSGKTYPVKLHRV